MSTPMTDEEAIRQVIADGAGGDFCDVAEVVRNRFGLRVSTQMVEQVFHQLQQEASPTTKDAGVLDSSKGSTSLPQPGALPGSAKKPLQFGCIDLALENEIPMSEASVPASKDQSLRTESVESRRDRILEFVKLMGGFNAARAAITELETSLKQLMGS